MPTTKINQEALDQIASAKRRAEREPMLALFEQHEMLFKAIGTDMKNVFSFLDSLEKRIILLENKYQESLQSKGKIGG